MVAVALYHIAVQKHPLLNPMGQGGIQRTSQSEGTLVSLPFLVSGPRKPYGSIQIYANYLAVTEPRELVPHRTLRPGSGSLLIASSCGHPLPTQFCPLPRIPLCCSAGYAPLVAPSGCPLFAETNIDRCLPPFWHHSSPHHHNVPYGIFATAVCNNTWDTGVGH